MHPLDAAITAYRRVSAAAITAHRRMTTRIVTTTDRSMSAFAAAHPGLTSVAAIYVCPTVRPGRNRRPAIKVEVDVPR